jgi:hypothetical protein
VGKRRLRGSFLGGRGVERKGTRERETKREKREFDDFFFQKERERKQKRERFQ